VTTAKLSAQIFSVIAAAVLTQTTAAGQSIDSAGVDPGAAGAAQPTPVQPAKHRARGDRASARVHHTRALALETDGKTTEAIQEEVQAIAFDPNDPAQQIHMGSLLIDDGQLANALATYEQVCVRFPNQSKYLQEIIDSLRCGLHVGAIEEAMQEFPNKTQAQRQATLNEIRSGIASDGVSTIIQEKPQNRQASDTRRTRRVARRNDQQGDLELYRLPGTEFNMGYVP
jgi:hypothetical protein